MGKYASPLDLWRTGMEVSMLVAETQAVMTLRMMGMAGVWSVTPSENSRMVSEKLPAFAKSATAAGTAIMTGKRPDQVMSAAVKPLRSKTRANSRRLAKRGLKVK
ncbi:antifreeze protein [Litoreibacter roseus]|uniref:Antifreeze protein, type I n=1 Tax=Litoreibacter roseus TaxID=2601869 RepID=A0A6N6JCY5_9RHOB|nr:antifreeze protein [Litoreibacter roseus]GFE64015.1 antifreeze protein, type I [Litoreibacter roseus]